jgi:DNA-binding transcriptional MerR regulator
MISLNFNAWKKVCQTKNLLTDDKYLIESRNMKNLAFSVKRVLGIIRQTEGVNLTRSHIGYYVKTGLIEPSVYKSNLERLPNIFSMEDVILLLWIVRLKKSGLSLQGIRKVISNLRNLLPEEIENPRGIYLVVVDDDVFLKRNKKEILSLLKKPGQLVMYFSLDEDVRMVRKLLAA